MSRHRRQKRRYTHTFVLFDPMQDDPILFDTCFAPFDLRKNSADLAEKQRLVKWGNALLAAADSVLQLGIVPTVLLEHSERFIPYNDSIRGEPGEDVVDFDPHFGNGKDGCCST